VQTTPCDFLSFSSLFRNLPKEDKFPCWFGLDDTRVSFLCPLVSFIECMGFLCLLFTMCTNYPCCLFPSLRFDPSLENRGLTLFRISILILLICLILYFVEDGGLTKVLKSCAHFLYSVCHYHNLNLGFGLENTTQYFHKVAHILVLFYSLFSFLYYDILIWILN